MLERVVEEACKEEANDEEPGVTRSESGYTLGMLVETGSIQGDGGWLSARTLTLTQSIGARNGRRVFRKGKGLRILARLT